MVTLKYFDSVVTKSAFPSYQFESKSKSKRKMMKQQNDRGKNTSKTEQNNQHAINRSKKEKQYIMPWLRQNPANV